MKSHTPPNEMLVEYASGAATPGIALLVAAHLTHAPESRRKVAELEALGGALLADEAPAVMREGALKAALGALEAGAEEPRPARGIDGGPLPRPVIDAVGIPFEEIPWRFRLPGIAEYEIAEIEGERISLLRARPGARIPQHTHEGTEMTLVLAGTLQDQGEVYGPGELAINAESDDHKPTIIGDETCYCLVVMDGRMRFTGTFSRVLNFLGE